MNVDLDRDLVRTLSAAASAAPEPQGDFASGVARRRHRYERARRVGLASVAAVVVAVSGTVGVVGLRGAPPKTVSPAVSANASASASPSATPVPPIDLSAVPPAERVWPGAVVTVPVALPDGRGIADRQILDDERLPGGAGHRRP